MGISIIKLDKDNDFTDCLQEIHLDLIEAIDEAYNTNMGNDFWEKMQNPNLAYLNFDGEIGDQYENVTFMAHSGINKPKKKEPITAYLPEVYELAPFKPYINSGYVNRLNNICVYDERFVKSNLKETIWKRDVDSESKVLESFIDILNQKNKEIAGELVLYTFYYPCLSCNYKVVKIIRDLSRMYPRLNIEIWYVEEYGVV